MKIITTWNINVLEKEIKADTNPLFKPVNIDEPKILNPLNKQDKA